MGFKTPTSQETDQLQRLSSEHATLLRSYLDLCGAALAFAGSVEIQGLALSKVQETIDAMVEKTQNMPAAPNTEQATITPSEATYKQSVAEVFRPNNTATPLEPSVEPSVTQLAGEQHDLGQQARIEDARLQAERARAA